MHDCNALVVCCIDYRFQNFMRKWTDENLAGKNFDLTALAGSTKESEAVMKQIEISVKLHNISEVVLIHHEDCGAYGTESTREKHAEDLKYAERNILTEYPQLQVTLVYLHLDGEVEVVK